MMAGWLIGDVLQPASYSPTRQTISVLAGRAGTDRWIMTSALSLVGACYLIAGLGLYRLRARPRVVLMISGLAAIGVAACPEPVSGSTPQHLAWTALGEVAIALWPAFVALPLALRPANLSVPVCIAMAGASLGLLVWLAVETQGNEALGLAERVTISVQMMWPFVVAVVLRSAPAEHVADHGQLEDQLGQPVVAGQIGVPGRLPFGDLLEQGVLDEPAE
jgi:hypothetical membrane protein